jgi:hypothetical protein
MHRDVIVDDMHSFVRRAQRVGGPAETGKTI